MNIALLHRTSSRRRAVRRVPLPRRPPSVHFRCATAADAATLYALIESHLEEGKLLPRQLDELAARAGRFVVSVRGGCIIGCAELAPLSARVAEIRSLVVARGARRNGIGRALVGALQDRARKEGFERLCAFTHDAGYFVRRGYSIVPHAWLPEKIAMDCQRCQLFRRCGQTAVQLSLAAADRVARTPSIELTAGGV